MATILLVIAFGFDVDRVCLAWLTIRGNWVTHTDTHTHSHKYTHRKCSWAMHNAISLLITCLLLLLADIWSCHWRDITFCDNYSGAVRRQFPPLDNCRCRRRCVWQQSQSSGHRGRMHPAPGQHKDVPGTTRSTRGLRMYQVAGTKLSSFIRMYQVSRCAGPSWGCTRPGPNPKTFWAGWMQRRRQVTLESWELGNLVPINFWSPNINWSEKKVNFNSGTYAFCREFYIYSWITY